MNDIQINNQTDIADDAAARRFAHMLEQLSKAFHA